MPIPAMTALHLTHYAVLGLTPSILDSSQQDPSALLKKAYHRALLRHHPDKKQSPGSASGSSAYTIDQIATAYAVLSSPGQRAAYDASLRKSHAVAVSARPRFQTGVENVDLDDLPFDGDTERWHRSCRCGNNRGYMFGEDDLVQVEDECVLLVGCQDCSLWLRVHFAVLNDATDSVSQKENIVDES